jgi:8-oxo-dGTP diphosphatase
MSRDYAQLPEMNMPFKGAKIALLCDGCVLVVLRDDDPAIPDPGLWDLPGGGREGTESPVACVLRETREEVGLALDPRVIRWGRRFGVADGHAWFFVGHVTPAQLAQVVLGDEGQDWTSMPVANFLAHPRAVTRFQERLRAYLESRCHS